MKLDDLHQTSRLWRAVGGGQVSPRATDGWDSDRFEDILTRTLIALYETTIDPQDVGRHWNMVRIEHWMAARRKVYIPAPDRLVWEDHIDGKDGIPAIGCVSFGEDRRRGPQDDRIEGYCRTHYFRRIPRLPPMLRRPANGPVYELMNFWMTDGGLIRASKTYHVLDSLGRARIALMPHQPRAGDKDVTAAEASLLGAMQFTADLKHTWTITAHTEDQCSVTIGAYADCVKSLLYARDLPVTRTGRKRPILHLVQAHRRRIKAGVDIDVRQFLRGTREVVMDGMRFTVQAPLNLQDAKP